MVNKVKKSKKAMIIRYSIIALVIIAGVLWFQFGRSKGNAPIIRTAVATRGPISSSVSATGVLQPITTVQVKSNVGGQVVKLAVDEGDIVHTGQLIAKIDPADSLAALQQSQADLRSSQSKVEQTRQTLDMQGEQTTASIAAAQQALETSKQRLAQAQKEAKVQPVLTKASINQAQYNLKAAQSSLDQIKSALTPQKLASAKAAYDQAKASYDQAQSDLVRKQALLDKGFISKSQMEAAQQQFGVTQAQLASAKNKLDTVNAESDQDLNSAQAKVDQAKAALDNAKANGVQDELKMEDYAAAKATYKQALAALDTAKAGNYQVPIRKQDIVQAQAALQRSTATVKDAQTQVGYTTVVAPRDGVVVQKYVEEGSIITGGKSSFSGSGSGVAIVDIADTTRMMALVNVDETDIAQVQMGQRVVVTVDAFPGQKFTGKVTKIAPQAVVTQNVTTIPVTVEVDHPDKRLKPAMNATCEFIVSEKDNVVTVPSSAVKETRRGTFVTVLKDGKQEKRPVKTGITGPDQTEIIEGVQEGETVITAIINLTPSTVPAGGGAPGAGGGSRPGGAGGAGGARGGGMRGPGMF